MRLLMHILKENKKLNIDNTKIGYIGIITKLEEEFREVAYSIVKYSRDRTLKNLIEVIAETFDLIQVCILILWRSHRESVKFDKSNLVQEVNISHKDKLLERQWIIETGIEIDVKE